MSEYILHKNQPRRTIITALFEHISKLDEAVDWEVSIEKKGAIRSGAQNRLQQLWHTEAAHQLKDEDAEDKRAYCKLHFGVPILREESEKFREEYDRVIRPMLYETKLALMKEPFDFPVTRLMTKAQKTRFLDAVWNHYLSQGVRLTHPDDLKGAA